MELQLIITDEMNEYIDEKSIEWLDNQDGGCNCPAGNPPCNYCVGCYGLPLAEYLELALEWEYGDDYTNSQPSTDHEDYDRAMKDLF